MKEILIQKPPLKNLETAWDAAEVISNLDRNDPHFKLKVANIIKCHGHRVKASENSNMIWRTRNYLETPEDFQRFFKSRYEKHTEFADSWWTSEGDNLKLKHHYSSEKPKHVKDCTSEGECRCWEINYERKEKNT